MKIALEDTKKNSKLIFFDEYSKKLIKEKDIKNFKTSFIFKLSELKNFDLNSNVLNKKLKNIEKSYQ